MSERYKIPFWELIFHMEVIGKIKFLTEESRCSFLCWLSAEEFF
jgi:hypothetical protein